MPGEPETTSASDTLAPGEANRPQHDRSIRCPTCRRVTYWIGNPQRPFCSVSCRLIDLGVWLDEGYAVRGEAPDDVR